MVFVAFIGVVVTLTRSEAVPVNATVAVLETLFRSPMEQFVPSSKHTFLPFTNRLVVETVVANRFVVVAFVVVTFVAVRFVIVPVVPNSVPMVPLVARKLVEVTVRAPKLVAKKFVDVAFVVVPLVNERFVIVRLVNWAFVAKKLVVVTLVAVTLAKMPFQRKAAEPRVNVASSDGKRLVLTAPNTPKNVVET
jgi:hypothetical protein